MRVDEIPGITPEQVKELRLLREMSLSHSRVRIDIDGIHGMNILVSVRRTEQLVRVIEPPELFQRAAEMFNGKLPEGYQLYVRAFA